MYARGSCWLIVSGDIVSASPLRWHHSLAYGVAFLIVGTSLWSRPEFRVAASVLIAMAVLSVQSGAMAAECCGCWSGAVDRAATLFVSCRLKCAHPLTLLT